MAGVASLMVDPSAGAVIAMAGAMVSTVKATLSVVVLPAASVAWRRRCAGRQPGSPGVKVQAPAASVGTVTGAPPSRTSWIVPERTSEVPVMGGVASLVDDPSAGAVMAMAGAIVSTVKSAMSEVVLPAASVAVATTVCGPSARVAGV